MVITDSLRLPAQGVMTVTLMAMLDPALAVTETMQLTNTAYVWARNRPQTLTDTAVVSVTANAADLAIEKRDNPDRVIKADDRTLTYTLIYTNYGPMAAQNVTLTDTLPNEVTFGGVVSQPAGWTGPAVGTAIPVTLSWVTPTLAVGQSGEIVLTVTVADDFAGVLTNYTNISTETPETRFDNNQDQEETEVDTTADVTIAKSGEPDAVTTGDQLVYTLVYTNNGPDTALNVVVSDTLIPEVQYLEANPTPRPPTDSVLWWDVGTLLSGESGTIVVTTTVTVAAVDTFTNTVQISTTTLETDYENNMDDEPTDVALADVAIRKVSSHSEAAPGESLVYTLTYQNLGSVPARDVVVWDDLPAEIIFDRAVPAPAVATNPLRWDLGTLDVGASGTILVYAHVRDDLERGTVVLNVAWIETSTEETDYTNNRDSAPTPVDLLGFSARYASGVVILEWETTWEVRTYGFKLYRGESARLSDATPIAFVFATGQGQSSGARYGYKDLGVEHGGTYYYWLVDVDLDGRETVHGPVDVTALPSLTILDSLSFVWVSRTSNDQYREFTE
jgi:uncharacterized repeat protein (TIGR01451 family)